MKDMSGLRHHKDLHIQHKATLQQLKKLENIEISMNSLRRRKSNTLDRLKPILSDLVQQ